MKVPPIIPHWLGEILTEPSCTIPEAGKALGLVRERAYAAARDGYIPTIEVGSRRRQVPTAWLRRQLQLEDLAGSAESAEPVEPAEPVRITRTRAPQASRRERQAHDLSAAADDRSAGDRSTQPS
jgi:hypothetical protein